LTSLYLFNDLPSLLDLTFLVLHETPVLDHVGLESLLLLLGENDVG